MDVNLTENAKCLRIYIGESDLWQGKPLYYVLLEVFLKGGIAGATVTRAIAGFGAQSRIHTATILRLSEDLPLVIEVVDSSEKISKVLDKVYPMVREGLILLEDVKVIKYTHRYLNPLPADRLVSDVMTRDIKILSPLQTVRQAWEQMLKQQIKAMPVVNDEGKVIGILTDEDLMIRTGITQRLSISKQLDEATIKQELGQLESTPLLVAGIMSKPVITVNAESTLGFAVNLMKKHQLKRLPVVDTFGKLVGNISRFDILRLVVPTSTKELSPLLISGSINQVSDIMSKTVPTVFESDDVATIIHTLLENNSHRLIVLDENNQVSGILSDTDVITRLPSTSQSSILAAFKKIVQSPISSAVARDLMTPNPITATPDLPIATAIQKMIKDGRKWMVIIDQNKHPVGLLDRQMLLESLASIPPTIN